VAAPIAKQREQGPDIGGNGRYKLGEPIFIGAVHLAEQLVPNRTKVVFEDIAA
jgi:hypothetical protein